MNQRGAILVRARAFVRTLVWATQKRLGRLRWRLGLSSAPPQVLDFVVAYNRYGGYCIPRAAMHRPACQRIIAGLVWEEATINYIKANRGIGDVITAGAFFGDALPALSKTAPSEAKVWAFEPNPENYRCAAITVLMNDLNNVSLTRGALGAERGCSRMLVTDPEGSSLGGAARLSAQGEVTVDVFAIDQIVPTDRQVTVLHLDVEGSEETALVGALETIRRNRPILILEQLPTPASRVQQVLESLGYRVDCKLGPENTALRPA
jgi:FkbM family methyltransferase